MRQIPLSGKHGEGKFALVDEEDFERVSKYKWYMDIRVKRRKDGSMPEYCHFRIRGSIGEGSPVALHRFVLGIYDPNVDIDHVDENPFNNTKGNLRPMDHVEHAKKSAAKRKKNLAERKKHERKTQLSELRSEDAGIQVCVQLSSSECAS